MLQNIENPKIVIAIDKEGSLTQVDCAQKNLANDVEYNPVNLNFKVFKICA
jgi:hypothetical protein